MRERLDRRHRDCNKDIRYMKERDRERERERKRRQIEKSIYIQKE